MVLTQFDKDFFLHNLALRRPDGTEDSDGIATLRSIVFRRMESHLITEEALDHIILSSGGIALDLVKLVRDAAGYARASNQPQERIDLAAARNASNDLRRELAASLSLSEWKLLNQRHRDRMITGEPDNQKLLYKGALIEYSNGMAWCDVHPVLWALLDYYSGA